MSKLLNEIYRTICIIYIMTSSFVITEASNSFTPVECYDCQPYSTNDINDGSTRQGQYVGSVMATPLNEQVSLNDNTQYNTPYNPASSSFLSVSSDYSTSSKVNASSSSSEQSYTNQQQNPSIKDRFHPTTYDVSQSVFRNPANTFAGGPFGNAAGGLSGIPGGATFRDPGGGFNGVQPGNAAFKPGGASSGNFPFGSLGSAPGGNGFFRSPGNGLGSSSLPFGFPGGIRGPLSGTPFRNPNGGNLAASVLGNGLFGSGSNGPLPGTAFRNPSGGINGNLGSGLLGNGLFGSGGNGPLSGTAFRNPGGGIPGNPPPGIFGNGLFGSGSNGPLPGTAFRNPGGGTTGNPAAAVFGNGLFGSGGSDPQGLLPGTFSGTPGTGNLSQLFGQQLIGEPESESGVGEVIQPAQTELKPEVVQSSNNGLPNESPPLLPNYGYGYSPSFYQQPLPDITEAPTPASPMTEIPSPAPPPPVIEGGNPVNPPPLPLPAPPVYGYYYIGRKAWYVPLYFCVYFILYVGCLILKHLLRHKAHYPETLHEAVINADDGRSNSLQLMTEKVLTAFDKFNNSNARHIYRR